MANSKSTPAAKAPAPKESAKSPAEAGDPTVMSERDVPGVGIVRVLTDGVRVWKDAPEDSGMGPLL